jgi:ATP-dependent DNA ligase
LAGRKEWSESAERFPARRGQHAGTSKRDMHFYAFDLLHWDGDDLLHRPLSDVPGKSSGDWIKMKLKQSDEFIVGGFIPGTHGVDQLVVGRYDGKDFKYVESLDDGFVPATRRKVQDAIQRYAVPECPFTNLPEKRGAHRMDREKMQKVTWVQPRVVVEIAMN